ncbi:acetolactate synthase-like protein isoform X3 [Varroa destructor]|uniref:2-hydroxyacyl-CoA lyase 2 n=1 Tax=Varroa destructor TaxID=109461 RepID=A0A7M7JJM6_VARDE|nr:acetolactate synthase-like protein isoform X3 [Varroa destructor]
MAVHGVCAFVVNNWLTLTVMAAISGALASLSRRLSALRYLIARVDKSSQINGGDLVAKVLKHHGITQLFCLSGGHISPILVGAEKLGIRIVDTRHEVNAVFAADAVARLTGNVGVAAVTAGPGVTNTITAVKNAQMAESPLLLLGGAAATVAKGRGALQDIDQLSLLKSICSVCDFRLSYGRVLSSKSKIVAVNRNKEQLFKNSDAFWKPTEAVQADVGSFLADLRRFLPGYKCDYSWVKSLRAKDNAKESKNKEMASQPVDKYLNPIKLLSILEEMMPDNTIIIADGGDFVATAAYILKPRGPLKWLDPGPFGTLGVGGGFAIGAKLAQPDANVIIIYGDGSAGYSLMEFDSFTRQKIPVTAIVGNDACWTQILREQIYRHGDRAPISIYPKDLNNVSFWRRGLGELTKEGCRMHYKLGTYLRAHYSNFLTGDPKEIFVQSSDKDRCLDSASCHLAGMYRPVQEQRFLPNFPWQPVPVHTRPNDEDGLLAPGNSNCPEADREFAALKHTDEGREFLAKYADFYRNLSLWTGDNVTDWESAAHVYDCVMIERLYGLPQPRWAIDHFDDLMYQQDQSFVWFSKTLLLQRLRAGPLAKEILHNIIAVTEKPTDVRLYMYSTHDTEIASLLTLYGLFDGKSPKYCATVIVELWQDITYGNYSVKILRLDYEDRKLQQVLHVPLPEFESRIASKLPENWARECGRKDTFVVDSRDVFAVAVVSWVALAFVCLISCCYCFCVRESNSKKTIMYQPLPTETIS